MGALDFSVAFNTLDSRLYCLMDDGVEVRQQIEGRSEVFAQY